MGWDGMGWDGMGWDGMGWDGMWVICDIGSCDRLLWLVGETAGMDARGDGYESH